MKTLIVFLGFLLSAQLSTAQQAFYDVTPGNGNGIRFWSGGTWAIEMGNQSENLYGPVTDFAIKTNMDGTPGRGWTWGVSGQAPVAGLNNAGTMTIAGAFTASRLSVGTQLTNRLVALYDNPSNWYGLGIQGSQFRMQVGLSTGRFSFFAGDDTEVMTVFGSGNVGIGTTSPDAKLAVAGQVHATEVKVTIAVPGPDYVFEKSYKLPSLEQIESFIAENKHLPEVPSAKEMETNGINLSEMNMLLLKKVEELTLYILEQERRIKALESRK